MKMPLLTTERLVLTVPGPERAQAFLAFNVENEAHLAPWEPRWLPEFRSVDYWQAKLAEWQSEYERGVSCRLAMFETLDGPPIGQANLTNFVRGALQAANLGYRIGAAHQGRGLMYEALSAVVPFAFEQLQLHRVSANYQPTNVRSGALLRRLGFAVEGYARDYLLIDGRWTDHVLTARVNERWPTS